MDWRYLRKAAWLDTRAHFVSKIPTKGALLDLGSSDGETLCHFHELRPDLRFYAADLFGTPEKYPSGCEFISLDLQTGRLPWSDASMDAITCMHLVEHLNSLENVFHEATRLLQPGARLYIETPHPKTVLLPSPKGDAMGKFTLNFFDDLTHLKPVTLGALAQHSERAGLKIVKAGVSRNLLFAAAYPLLKFSRPGRKRYTAQVHWLGWSNYFVAERAA